MPDEPTTFLGLQALSRRRFMGSVAASAVVGLPFQAKAQSAPGSLTPFRFHAPQAALNDLRNRLAQTRWPERETVSGWTQGVPEGRLRSWIDYWRGGYDWRRCEASLNRFDQYRAD